MEITSELIATLYERAEQFGIAKYGGTFDRIELQEDGTIALVDENYYCGERDTTIHYIDAEMLTADLDEIVTKRKAEEERQRQIQENLERQRQKERKIREEQERRRTYEKLKKEFEG